MFPVLRSIYSNRTKVLTIYIYSNIKGVKWVFVYRESEKVLEFSNSVEVMDWSQRGPLTPGIMRKNDL